MHFLAITILLFIIQDSSSKLIKLQLSKLPSDNKELQFLSDTFESDLQRTHLLEGDGQTSNGRVQTLVNHQNVQYYTTLQVGSNNQSLNVLVDTGSNLLWLPSSNIVGRPVGNRFNYLLSSSFKNLNQTKSVQYAVGKVDGLLVSDRVSIASDIVIPEQNFLLVTHATALEPLVSDGVLGLNIDNEGDSKNSFIEQLAANKVISSPSFALHLTGLPSNSTLLLGDLAEAKELDTLRSQMGSCNVPVGAGDWECNLEIVNINNKDISVSSKVIFDSGAAFTVIPISDFKNIRNESLSNATCALNSINQLVCKCSSATDFPPVTLRVNGNNITIRQEQLVTYDPSYDFACRFNVVLDLNLFGSWVLGEAALRGMLVSYEVNARKISFVRTDTLPSNIVFQAPAAKGFNWWILFWIFLILLLLVLGYIIYKYCFASAEGSEGLVQKNQ